MSNARAHRTVLAAVAGAALIVPLTPPADARPTSPAAPAPQAVPALQAAPTSQAALAPQAAPVPRAASAPQARPVPAATPAPAAGATYDEVALAPAAGARAAAVAKNRTKPFSMVGVTWPYRASSADVTAKVRVLANGVWSGWQQLHIEDENGIDPGARNRGRSGTEPFWVEMATGVQVSVTTPDGATLRDAKVVLINPGTRSADATTQPQAVPADKTAAASPAPAPTPSIASRAAWGADESLRRYNGAGCATPKYAKTVHAAFVHHTADSNSYTSARVPALLRSTYAYHVKSRGWCDIGYNFLVDKFGRAFEGRYGGIARPVIGAHTGGYNTNSFGVSLIGNFDSATPSAAVMDRVARIIAWKYDTNYRSPLSTVVMSGKRLNTVSGHRDTKQTACPGRNVYSRLPALRQRIWALMGRSFSTEIYRYAQYLGGYNIVGAPWWGEHSTGAGGRTTWFGGHDIYASSTAPPRSVYGTFRTRYRQLSNAVGPLGEPRGWQQNAVIPNARMQAFRNGRIYDSNVTSAQPVYGSIMRLYGQLGAERSRLGLPSGPPYRASSAVLRQTFQRGWITWNTRTGAVVHRVTS